ncbi:hypothetical protein [Nocardia altamirensis]|uniref:hypothetical protein n=1 Tax=Nocardia altamirensis TaxID=472158 RepID=UPI0008407A86|nr:hypothetical protein [Nocardia altamirensis]
MPDNIVPFGDMPVSFTGTLAAENRRAIETAIRRGISQAILECRDDLRSPVPHYPPTLDEIAAEGPLKPEREWRLLDGDILRIGPTPSSPVIDIGKVFPHWIQASGHLEVETGDPVRAVNWGRYLFGDRGYAVLTRSSTPDRLLVRPLAEPLREKDFGGFVPAISNQPGHGEAPTRVPAAGGRLVTDPGLQPLIVATADGHRLYRKEFADSPTEWAGENIDAWLADPSNPGALDRADAARVIEALTYEYPDDLAIAHFLVTLDRSLYKTMTAADRARYLHALMRVSRRAVKDVDSEQLGAAIVELLASCPSKWELDALLLPLAADGTLLKLFSQSDKPTFQLLFAVGRHIAVTPPTPEQLLELLGKMLKNPRLIPDIEQFLSGGYDWGRRTAGGVGELPRLPLQIVEIVPKMFELYWLLCRAFGAIPVVPIPGMPNVPLGSDPEALAQVHALLAHAGSAGSTALAGLSHIEALLGAKSSVTDALAQTVHINIVLEVLTAFAGVPAAAALATLKTLTTRVRLYEALATALKWGDVGEVGRIIELLPARYQHDLTAILDNAPKLSRNLGRFLTTEEKRAAARRLQDAMEVAKTIKQAVGPRAELAEVWAGANHILEVVGTKAEWSAETVNALLRGVPGTEMPVLLRIADRLEADWLATMDAVTFIRVARARGAEEFVADAGPAVVRITAHRFGTTTARYEHFLARVAEARKSHGPQKEYQLWERLTKDDPFDFGDSDMLERAKAAAKHALYVEPRETIPASALGDIAKITDTQVFRRRFETFLRDNPDHPLRFLLDEETGRLHAKFGDAVVWNENSKQLEISHLTSAKSGGTDMVLGSRHTNQWDSRNVEGARGRGSFHVTDQALEIGGWPVEQRTALDWVLDGFLDPDVLARARWISYRP